MKRVVKASFSVLFVSYKVFNIDLQVRLLFSNLSFEVKIKI